MNGRSFCSSFIAIKYGDNDEKLFNPNCSLRVLINDIRKRCHCPPSSVLAVAEERGTNGDILVMQIPDTMDNGRTHFKDRGSYILLTVQKMGQNSQYSSLLDSEHMSQELKDKLHNLNNPRTAKTPRTSTHTRKPKLSTPGSRASRRQSSSSVASVSSRGKK